MDGGAEILVGPLLGAVPAVGNAREGDCGVLSTTGHGANPNPPAPE